MHSTIGVDRSGSGDEYSQEEIIVRQIINHAGQGPQIYDDLIHVIAPDSRHTGSAMLKMARYNDVFLDSQYENGSQGTAFEYELIYYPTTTDGGVEGLKRPTPDNVAGVNMSDQGDNKEAYRWHWLIENNRRQDDYSQMIETLKTLGGRTSDPNFQQDCGGGHRCRRVAAGVCRDDPDRHRRQLLVRRAAQRHLLCPSQRQSCALSCRGTWTSRSRKVRPAVW